MNNYLIKLIPQSPFFFGGEKTFGDGHNTNYFAKSSPFPQQTSILGMLRKNLLIQHNIFKENWDDYTEIDRTQRIPQLIGQAFQMNIDNNFGKIKRLSPVFIANSSGFFMSEPKDNGFIYQPKTGQCRLHCKKSYIPFLQSYNAKQGLPNGFMSSTNNDDIIAFDKVFKAFEKVGNAKERTEDDSEKFFKQQFFTMINDYCFAFFAEFDCELDNEAIVFIGADNSTFKLQAEKTDDSFEKQFITGKSHANKITLLSNALIDESIYDDCEFAITNPVDFRTIVMEEGRFKHKSNQKYSFLERGSVFFTENKPSLEKKLKNNQLEKIGYNIFK